ncbi:RloB family protein [Micromonospora sp. WMMD961]|uniref:RloB family protein n=1 Tax=Micromonospora sp. WMMD961 TaxID=3016100 RepID=UPI0024174154|nr:RloB family protein [Micromonospora sp. WMMD961]MDG4779581.1 RloB family protein [Micromonospora sp. WMMD961]
MAKPQTDQQQRKGRAKVGATRVTDLRRRVSVREQRRTILAVTNGKSTERGYLEGLRWEPWLEHRLVVAVETGSPIDAARGAARRRNDSDFDEAYVICDVDHYPPELSEREARRHDVTLLWSNPCFEVWLILHLDLCTRYLEDAKRAEALLRKHLPHWDKTRLDFDDFRNGIEAATERAQTLPPPPAANPSTAVWRLALVLRG